MGFTQRWATRFTDYADPQSKGRQFRMRRVAPLLRMIEDVHRERGAVRIADVGGTERYWDVVPAEFLRQHGVHVTLINLGGSYVATRGDLFTYAQGDGCDLKEHSAGAFDIAHSNSVIEHVGDWSRMVSFAREARRIAPRYFVQTPNFWFPVEPHCMTPLFHWLPRPVRVSMVQRFALGNWRKEPTVDGAARMVDSVRLLDRKMIATLFPDAEILPERYGPFVKSYVAVRDGPPRPKA
jgi:hypothetical protein